MKIILILLAVFSLSAPTQGAKTSSILLFWYPKTPSGEKSGERALKLIDKKIKIASFTANGQGISVYILSQYRESAWTILEDAVRKEHLDIKLFPTSDKASPE